MPTLPWPRRIDFTHCSRSTAYFRARRTLLSWKGLAVAIIGMVVWFRPVTSAIRTLLLRCSSESVLISTRLITLTLPVSRAFCRATESATAISSASSTWALPGFQ
ncbi:hypothetical protein FQZ97_1124450 [compost metagenome]